MNDVIFAYIQKQSSQFKFVPLHFTLPDPRIQSGQMVIEVSVGLRGDKREKLLFFQYPVVGINAESTLVRGWAQKINLMALTFQSRLQMFDVGVYSVYMRDPPSSSRSGSSSLSIPLV
ncbi:hypothetical protein L5D93_29695 [Paenibacillus thiaminolyticus]|nr:hypothetical protein [Paenibacillus thiaminolyticus]